MDGWISTTLSTLCYWCLFLFVIFTKIKLLHKSLEKSNYNFSKTTIERWILVLTIRFVVRISIREYSIVTGWKYSKQEKILKWWNGTPFLFLLPLISLSLFFSPYNKNIKGSKGEKNGESSVLCLPPCLTSLP